MYIGADFLIDKNLGLFLSEVNTGVPAGTQEFDFIYKEKFKKSSGVFQKIESLSQRYSGKNFFDYINELPFIDDLRALKIWMDGKGPLPKNPSKALRLEDKWIQHQILSRTWPTVPTEIFKNQTTNTDMKSIPEEYPIVLKKRYGRGGKGFHLIQNAKELRAVKIEKNGYIIQPYVDSAIGPFRLSIRAAAFMGTFICMFASLSKKLTSNHGIRFFVRPGNGFKLTNENFEVKEIIHKSWEADIFYKRKIPDYLYHDVYEETIGLAELIIPQRLYKDIQKISASISHYYKNLDLNTLPRAYIEEINFAYACS
jgi:hypothetical protein